MTHTHKLCACCKDCKPVDQFHKMTASADGKQSYCAACMDLKVNEWRRKNGRRPGALASRQKWAAIAQEAARL
jgi:hypothetical protein